MSDGDIVVDASVILALLQGEPFEASSELIVDAYISAVNLSEVLTKLRSGGATDTDAIEGTKALGLRVIAFGEPHAEVAAKLSQFTRRAGLSFGDRACLATAALLGATALTADRAWAKLDIPTKVMLIR